MGDPSTPESAAPMPFDERLQALCAWLPQQVRRIEAAGRLPPDVMQRLHEVELFRMTLPVERGGLGMTPAQAWRVVIELGRGSASVAWVVSLCVINTIIALRLPDALQGDLFDADAPLVMSALVGVPGREVKAIPEAGGVRLSGCWDYASGIDVAGWVALLVMADGAGAPSLALVPQSAFFIDAESWQVLGLRGTGSKSCRLVDVFVPDHRRVDYPSLHVGPQGSLAPAAAALPGYPLIVLLTMSVLAPLLGVATAVVDAFQSFLTRRIGGDPAWRDPFLTTELAQARTAIEMACDSLVQDAERSLAITAAGGVVSESERAAWRMRLLVTADHAKAAAMRLFGLVGGQILPIGAPFESLLRDLHAMASHRLLQPQPSSENLGRLLCGLGVLPGTRV